MTRKEIESLFKTHYTQMYHLALTLLFDEAESKDVVSEVFASLLNGRTVVRTDNAKSFLLASVHHRCLNVLQHKKVKERFARLLLEDADILISDNTDALRAGQPVANGAGNLQNALPKGDDLSGSGRSAERQPPDRPRPPEAVSGENQKAFRYAQYCGGSAEVSELPSALALRRTSFQTQKQYDD